MHTCTSCGGIFQDAGTCPRDQIALVEARTDPLVGRVLGDRYRILEMIGDGGMGVVYRAAHTRIASTFAVKIIWGEFALDEDMQRRFIREAETASCLSHRSIVRVTDFGTEGTALNYLVMDFLEGTSLRDELMRQGAMGWQRASRIVGRIARGLAHAHARGVVHRDLKPDNILLVAEDDEVDIVKLLDFGIAVSERDQRKLTRVGQVVGTPNYMAPEQLRAQAVDGRTDLYALGCLYFELLAGVCPFDAPRPEDIALNQISMAPPSLEPILTKQGGPPAIEAIVRRLLAKKPAERYASAKELVAALAALDAPAKSIAPPSSSQRRVAPISAEAIARIEGAILRGAPIYNVGDHAECARIYTETAREIVAQGREDVAVSARFEAALSRARLRANPTDAAWDLRNAFDDLVHAPTIPDDDDLLVRALSAYGAIAVRREAEGRFDVLGDYQVMFTRALAARLREAGGNEDIARKLEAASDRGARAGGGEAARLQIEPLMGSLRAGREPVSPVSGRPRASTESPASLAQPRSIAPPSTAPASTTLPRSSAALRERVTRAIRVGAPLYNGGDSAGCARLYRDAATEMLMNLNAQLQRTTPRVEDERALKPLADHLERALANASTQAPDRAAWVLRYAFDALLAG